MTMTIPAAIQPEATALRRCFLGTLTLKGTVKSCSSFIIPLMRRRLPVGNIPRDPEISIGTFACENCLKKSAFNSIVPSAVAPVIVMVGLKDETPLILPLETSVSKFTGAGASRLLTNEFDWISDAATTL